MSVLKILYAGQATGNGHLTRVRDLAPQLSKRASVDILLSGAQADADIGFGVRYRREGLPLSFGRSGEVRYIRTLSRLNPRQLLEDIRALSVAQYDIVVTDFEPVAAWAGYLGRKPVVAVSHQASFLSPKTPRPTITNPVVEAILKWQAPCTHAIGFHFERYDSFIQTPLIRNEIRQANIRNGNHYVAYLPSYGEHVLAKRLSQIDVEWEVFSRSCTAPHRPHNNVLVSPACSTRFAASLAGSAGLLTCAGFQSPSEALFLGKKLLVIPMRGHYEQRCNAMALRGLGVPVLHWLNPSRIEAWINSPCPQARNYPDNQSQIIDAVIEIAAQSGCGRSYPEAGPSPVASCYHLPTSRR